MVFLLYLFLWLSLGCFIVKPMTRFDSYFSQDWYLAAAPWQQELIRISIELVSREERMHSSFVDYSFLVFPMAKAYEGYLKDYFYKVNLIDRDTYLDKRFRIGKAMNPDMSPSHRDQDWVYEELTRRCGPELGRDMWNAWLECRNQLFHYFPENEKKVNLAEAIHRIEMLANVMEGMTRCKIRTL